MLELGISFYCIGYKHEHTRIVFQILIVFQDFYLYIRLCRGQKNA